MFRKSEMYFDVDGHNWKCKLHLKYISDYLVNSLNVGFHCKIPKMFECISGNGYCSHVVNEENLSHQVNLVILCH